MDIYSIGDVIHKLMNAQVFIKTLMDQLATLISKTKWRKQRHKFSWIFEWLKALLGGCTMTLNISPCTFIQI